jgi:hypothetical protein
MHAWPDNLRKTIGLDHVSANSMACCRKTTWFDFIYATCCCSEFWLLQQQQKKLLPLYLNHVLKINIYI